MGAAILSLTAVDKAEIGQILLFYIICIDPCHRIDTTTDIDTSEHIDTICDIDTVTSVTIAMYRLLNDASMHRRESTGIDAS